ncbi:MAG: hypothetical protein Kow0065_10250 [Methylomicrobium sp.]
MIDLLISGCELMVIGMGIVYLFLAMLVFTVNLMSTLVQLYLTSPADTPSSVQSVPSKQTGLDSSLVAAISGAVHQYRNDRT